MGNSFQVEVSESREQLQHRLRHAVTATTKERLQMLYWIKTKAIATRQELSQPISAEAIASICGWDYITSALLSATS